MRKHEDFVPDSEHRHFVFDGCAHSVGSEVPFLISYCAAAIASPFFSVDTASVPDGTVRIVELGDGQVSDRKEWNADQFVGLFA